MNTLLSRWTLFDSYDTDLCYRFYDAGVDLTKDHEMAQHLGEYAGNKPLFGFAKRHREDDPAIQRELDLGLDEHTAEGNEKGVLLSRWAGADPCPASASAATTTHRRRWAIPWDRPNWRTISTP